MPATETTWRSQPQLHRAFAVTGILLTAATVWMFYADHYRDWKQYQVQTLRIDQTLNEMRQEQVVSSAAFLDHEEFEAQHDAASAAPVPPALVEQFLKALDAYYEFKGSNGSGERKGIERDLKTVNDEAAKASADQQAAAAALKKLEADPGSQDAQRDAKAATRKARNSLSDVRGARAALIARMDGRIRKVRIDEDKALNLRKVQNGLIDAAKAQRDIAIRDNLSQEEIAARQQEVYELEGKDEFGKVVVNEKGVPTEGLAARNHRYQTLSGQRRAMEKALGEITAAEDAAKKKAEEAKAELVRLEVAYNEKRETWATWDRYPWVLGKKVLTLPILDAFGTPRKVENLWSKDLEQNYNFSNVRRFDRCTTCHQSLPKSLPGEPTSPAYEKSRLIEMVIVPPAKEDLPPQEVDSAGLPRPYTLEQLLGIRLANEGLINGDDVTIGFVRPKSPAASASLTSDLDAAKDQNGLDLRLAAAQFHEPPSIEESLFPVRPGLMLGDVIQYVNDDQLFAGTRNPQRIEAMLIDLAQRGEPIRITVRRGFPHPFTSHPRLDLYVSDASPHKLGTFACTICHDGQGSATDFEWASHTPNNVEDADQWRERYGWFDNPHWIYPMYPKRFAESACLKCHHEVVELEPSERYPDAPAPKVTHGYHLIRKYGCFGCHETNGFDGPTKRVGPDLRLEPNYFAVALELVRNLDIDRRETHFQQLLERELDAEAGDSTVRELQAQRQDAAGRRLTADEKKKQLAAEMNPANDAEIAELDMEIAAAQEIETTVNQALADVAPRLANIEEHLGRLTEARELADRLAAHPEDAAARNRLRALLDEDAAAEAGQFGQTFTVHEHRLANMLKDIEAPGSLRKAGPSLRYVGDKLDTAFLYDWIANPQHFRESTRMPRFFGLWNHLADESGKMHDEQAPKLEPVEIRGLIAYLTAYDQPMPMAEGERQQIEQALASADAEQGKTQFEVRGCLACHTHKDFPDTAAFRKPEDIVQGPDLSALASKFDASRNPNGPAWLYAWIKEPTRYHARTVMPNLFMNKEQAADGTETDPAADVAAYLLSAASKSDWQPIEQATANLPHADLDDLTLQYLKETFFEDGAQRYLDQGIPPDMEAELKGAEVEMVVAEGKPLTTDHKLRYIGKKSIAKYGCYGCHDVPGFEDAKPIGTGLADWGRKDPSRLAFEHVTHYLSHHGSAHADHGAAAESHAGHAEPESAADAEYYHHQIEAGSRIGFIYQKLREPRSYDFEKTENKRYNERLRMPQFPFSAAEREAVITFVLGLVSEPPREKYLYQPSPRQKAIIQGKQVLEKYNCGGCHVLEAETWNVRYASGAFGPQDVKETYPYLIPEFSTEELAKAGEPDAGNRLTSRIRVLPSLNPQDGLPIMLDAADGTELDNSTDYPPGEVKHFVDLYEHALLDGQPYLTGQKAIQVSKRDVVNRYPATGGLLTRYLLPRVTALEKEANPQAKGSEAWGWLPPPLIGEGSKVQSNWLHDFLLEPYPIRPAVFLRMPKFNMSSQEATALVNYFSAVDNAEYPYEFAPARQQPALAAKETAYRARQDVQSSPGDRPEEGSWRFADAMKIVVNKNYCTQCHKVGDFAPEGSVRAMAPNLADVYRRLRPEYTRNWIANPVMILPYTPMPVNIPYVASAPYHGGISQELYHGTSEQQVDALVDLLMNYDQFTREQTSIRALVPPAAPAPAASGGTNESRSAEE